MNLCDRLLRKMPTPPPPPPMTAEEARVFSNKFSGLNQEVSFSSRGRRSLHCVFPLLARISSSPMIPAMLYLGDSMSCTCVLNCSRDTRATWAYRLPLAKQVENHPAKDGLFPEMGVISLNSQNFSRTDWKFCEIEPKNLEHVGQLSFSGIIKFQVSFILSSQWLDPLLEVKTPRGKKFDRFDFGEEKPGVPKADPVNTENQVPSSSRDRHTFVASAQALSVAFI